MNLKPTLNKIIPFDADYDYTFEFEYQGNQPYLNQLLIYKKDNEQLIYDETIESMQLVHKIPAHTLANNQNYYARIICYDVNSAASEISDKLYFTCYSTPTVSLLNLMPNGTSKIASSNYDIQVQYTQKQNRPLKEFIFNLYDAAKSDVVYSSGTRYYATEMNHIINCGIKSLENNCIYYFEFIGITVDDVMVSLPKTAFYVSYKNSNCYSVFDVECDEKAGYMKYHTYMVIVEGHAAGRYELDNGILKIIDEKIYYDAGFLISGDFLVGIQYRNGTRIELSNADDNIILSRNDYEGQEYYKLEAGSSGLPASIQYSKLYDKNGQFRTVYIKRQNGLYDLKIVESEKGGGLC